MTMTSPAVTELPRRLEPVSRDTFLDELALGEERLDRELSVALTALRLDEIALGPRRGRTRVASL
jgi:hypothetical protein